jgi:hypothetical protein
MAGGGEGERCRREELGWDGSRRARLHTGIYCSETRAGGGKVRFPHLCLEQDLNASMDASRDCYSSGLGHLARGVSPKRRYVFAAVPEAEKSVAVVQIRVRGSLVLSGESGSIG